MAMKINVLCTILAFERSLIQERCGRGTARCHC